MRRGNPPQAIDEEDMQAMLSEKVSELKRKASSETNAKFDELTRQENTSFDIETKTQQEALQKKIEDLQSEFTPEETALLKALVHGLSSAFVETRVNLQQIYCHLKALRGIKRYLGDDERKLFKLTIAGAEDDDDDDDDDDGGDDD